MASDGTWEQVAVQTVEGEWLAMDLIGASWHYLQRLVVDGGSPPHALVGHACTFVVWERAVRQGEVPPWELLVVPWRAVLRVEQLQASKLPVEAY